MTWPQKLVFILHQDEIQCETVQVSVFPLESLNTSLKSSSNRELYKKNEIQTIRWRCRTTAKLKGSTAMALLDTSTDMIDYIC